MREVHPTAAAGFAAAADDYDRYRPTYPDELTTVLRSRLDLRPGRVVLDLAAGTGKLTSHLVESGADVLAVEPVESMRAHLARALPHVAVLDGTAEDLPLPRACVDAVAVGQAFHWFETGPALAELSRILRPDGRLAIVFNERALETPVQAALDDLLAPLRGRTPSWADHSWRAAIEDPAGFVVTDAIAMPHAQRVDLDGFLGRIRSISFVAMLGTDELQGLLDDAGALFDRIQVGGRAELSYHTRTWILRPRPPRTGGPAVPAP